MERISLPFPSPLAPLAADPAITGGGRPASRFSGKLLFGVGVSVWLGHWAKSCNCRATGRWRKKPFPFSGSMQSHLISQAIEVCSRLCPCRQGRGTRLVCCRFPSLRMEFPISGKLQCWMHQIFPSSTHHLCWQLVLAIGVRWKEEVLKIKFSCVLYWNCEARIWRSVWGAKTEL